MAKVDTSTFGKEQHEADCPKYCNMGRNIRKGDVENQRRDAPSLRRGVPCLDSHSYP